MDVLKTLSFVLKAEFSMPSLDELVDKYDKKICDNTMAEIRQFRADITSLLGRDFMDSTNMSFTSMQASFVYRGIFLKISKSYRDDNVYHIHEGDTLYMTFNKEDLHSNLFGMMSKIKKASKE